jgi:hypothetical protein
MSKFRVDEKTLEKGLVASSVALARAYSVTHRVSLKKAKEMAIEFISKEILEGSLNAISGVKRVRGLFAEMVDAMIEEYKDKRDKSYTALLRLRESLKE